MIDLEEEIMQKAKANAINMDGVNLFEEFKAENIITEGDGNQSYTK